MEWLQDNATVVSAMATAFMALVWLVYAHIGVIGFLHHRRPRVIIDQTEDRTLDTKFVVVNLSERPVYISCIMVAIQTDDDERVRKISTYTEVSSENGDQSRERIEAELRQGTLDSAQLLMLGDTDRLLSWMLDGDDPETPRGERLRRALVEIDAIEIRVIAVVGVEDRPIASCRQFLIDKSGDDVRIRPRDSYTQHLTSRKHRGTIQQWSEFCLRN
jgi:hypothetical protein